jgi:hypothetical protein
LTIQSQEHVSVDLNQIGDRYFEGFVIPNNTLFFNMDLQIINRSI